MEFNNDYRGVHNSLTAGREVNEESQLGRQLWNLSNAIMDRNGPKREINSKKKFLEFFSVTGPATRD
jgi:hypothetical protein